MSQEETKRRTYRFGEFEDLSQIVTPANGLHDWNTIKDWLEFYPFAVLQNWNSHWIKKPKEPLRAEFECSWWIAEGIRYPDVTINQIAPFIGKRTRVIIEEIPEVGK